MKQLNPLVLSQISSDFLRLRNIITTIISDFFTTDIIDVNSHYDNNREKVKLSL
jgi:hypothetical protein